jgi:hypothetical protein
MPKIKISLPNNPAATRQGNQKVQFAPSEAKPTIDLSPAFDARVPSVGQAQFNKLMTPQVRQHVTAALSHHMGISDKNPGRYSPVTSPDATDQQGQDQVAQSEKIANLSGGEGPDTTVADNPLDLPVKAPKTPVGPAPQADFSSLGS